MPLNHTGYTASLYAALSSQIELNSRFESVKGLLLREQVGLALRPEK